MEKKMMYQRQQGLYEIPKFMDTRCRSGETHETLDRKLTWCFCRAVSQIQYLPSHVDVE